MSIADAKRFAKDLGSNKELAAKVKSKASGLASLVTLGKASGYSFTVDEIKQVIRDTAKRDLSDAQLEAIAGGQGQQQPSSAVATTATTNSNTVSLIQVLDYTQTQQVGQIVSVVVQLVA